MRHRGQRAITCTGDINEDAAASNGRDDSGLRQHVCVDHRSGCTNRTTVALKSRKGLWRWGVRVVGLAELGHIDGWLQRVVIVAPAQRGELIAPLEQVLPECDTGGGRVRIGGSYCADDTVTPMMGPRGARSTSRPRLRTYRLDTLPSR